MKRFLYCFGLLLFAAMFSACSNDDDALSLAGTTWKGTSVEQKGTLKNTYNYQITFDDENKGTDVCQLIQEMNGKVVSDVKLYCSFTYDFNGKTGDVIIGETIRELYGIPIRKPTMPDTKIIYWSKSRTLKTYANLPCKQVAYSPIRIPEIDAGMDGSHQTGNVEMLLGKWSDCTDSATSLSFGNDGIASFTYKGTLIAEGSYKYENDKITFNGLSDKEPFSMTVVALQDNILNVICLLPGMNQQIFITFVAEGFNLGS